MIDWASTERRLEEFWSRLPDSCRVVSDWTPSRRFPEVTFVREELLGSYKARKYLSLLPWLKEQGFKKVRVHGSSHSGNVVQLGLLLGRAGIEPVYMMEGRGGPPAGNALLGRLVYGSAFKSDDSPFDYAIPEGGSCPAALAGSLGLAGSVVWQTLRHKRWVPEIWIDSGTGFSAVALLLGLGFFALPWRVTIVSMTGQKRADFEEQVERLSSEFESLMGVAPGCPEFEVRPPTVGPSFGSVPAASLAEVERFAAEESILVDPIYTAKLSLAYQSARSSEAECLMFISGGVRELLCFQGPLRKWLERG